MVLTHIRAAFKHAHSRSLTTLLSNGPRKGDKVVVAMSGGVDSSVAALILSQKVFVLPSIALGACNTNLTPQDYDLSAVYMRNWDTRDEYASEVGCEWKKDWEDVQGVCGRLGIPCELIDLSTQYWTRVFEPALRDYEDGLTPNPDVFCNREIKFGVLLEKAAPGFNHWLATGHYAKIAWTEDDRPRLIRARDRAKDQSYFLSSVPEISLRKTLFPLGALLKSDVRRMARNANLPTANRIESMGLCFVGEKRKFNHFLSNYLPPKLGSIIDQKGQAIAEHQGLWRYTIGQGAKIQGMKDRMFVASKNIATNQLLVVPGTDHAALYCRSIIVKDWKWIWPDFSPRNDVQLTVKIRYLMHEVNCTFEQRSLDCVNITFAHPEKAVAPGQVAVIWYQEWCLGCGTISETLA